MKPQRLLVPGLLLAAAVIVGVIWRETFVPVGAEPLDIPSLAQQHVELWLRGMRPDTGAAA